MAYPDSSSGSGMKLLMHPSLSRVLALLVSSVCSLSVNVLGQAVVSGTVVDRNGAEVPYAFVEALSLGDPSQTGVVGDILEPWKPADSQGAFHLKLPPGAYKIEAKAELSGYPIPGSMLTADSTSEFPIVTVSQTDIRDVRVVMGAKGGMLQGIIRNHRTHEAVAKAMVKISDAGDADSFVETSADERGRFHFTVPSKSIAVFASAAGYREGPYQGGSEFVLSPGERRSIVIELDPQ